MDKKPLVTVVLLTKNGGADFEKTLKVLFSQKVGFPFEVLAIDSGSTDGTWGVLEGYRRSRKNLRLEKISPGEFRHGPTRNKAMEMAQGEIVVFLVQDALPVGEDWLATLVGSLIKDGGREVAGVSGRQVPPEDLPIPQKFFLLMSYTDQPRVMNKLVTEFGPGNIWFSNVESAIRKSVWRKFRFADVVMSEDQEWSRRVLAAGYKLIYEPRAKVIHGHNLPLRNVFRRNVDSGASLSSLGAVVKSVGSGRMWRYLGEELRYALGEGGLSGALYVLPYELTRWLGFQIGYRRWIPRSVKKFFSVVPWYYD